MPMSLLLRNKLFLRHIPRTKPSTISVYEYAYFVNCFYILVGWILYDNGSSIIKIPNSRKRTQFIPNLEKLNLVKKGKILIKENFKNGMDKKRDFQEKN
jgi:hypothetical protein